MAVDQYATFLNIVVAEEKTEDCGFSAAAWANNGNLLSGGNGEIKVLEDGAVGTVAEGYVFEFEFAGGEEEGFGVWLVLDLELDLLKIEEGFHVEETLTEFTVDRAEEVEGDGELEDELVDHDEVSDGEVTGCDAVSSKVHHGSQGAGEDQVLARVEES